MTRIAASRAIATKTSIAALWAYAESQGTVTIRLSSRAAAINIRNKIYAHRAALRRATAAHTGIEASHLDVFTFELVEEFVDGADGYPIPTSRWLFTITLDLVVEFELLLPDDYDPGPIPHFDLAPEPPAPDHEPEPNLFAWEADHTPNQAEETT